MSAKIRLLFVFKILLGKAAHACKIGIFRASLQSFLRVPLSDFLQTCAKLRPEEPLPKTFCRIAYIGYKGRSILQAFRKRVWAPPVPQKDVLPNRVHRLYTQNNSTSISEVAAVPDRRKAPVIVWDGDHRRSSLWKGNKRGRGRKGRQFAFSLLERGGRKKAI